MRPPRLPEWLLGHVSAAPHRHALLAELRDEYERRAVAVGESAAARWYWRQALRSAVPLAKTRLAVARLPHTHAGPAMRRSIGLESFILELRGGVRSLMRSKGVTLAAVLTMALGIGAATAIFSVVNGVLLTPLPYADPSRLVVVIAEQDFDGTRQPVRTQWPAAAVSALSKANTVERIGFYSRGSAALSTAHTSELVQVAYVSSSFFPAVGGQIALGRGLMPTDDLSPSAVISERLWRRDYGGLPDVLGQPVRLSGEPYTIVGVAADTFQIPEGRNDIWTPAAFARTKNPVCCRFAAVARLKPDVGLSTATDEIAAVARTLAAQMPRELGGVRVRLVPLQDAIVGETRDVLLVLSAAVGLLLLIASGNVMNLLLARNSARTRETAVRRALGASRARLMLMGFAETTVLTAAGTLSGVAIAALSIHALKAWPPIGLPRLEVVEVDARVLVFACLLAAAVTLVMGLLPSLQSAEQSLSLRQKGIVGGQGRRIVLRSLTVAQLTMSLILLVGASLLARSLVALMQTDLGVVPQQVATASLNLGMGRPMSDQQQIDLVSRVVERISSLPHVTSAGVGTARPPDVSRMRLTLNRTNDPDARATFLAAGVPATPGYFPALGIRLERGRVFTTRDGATAPPVVMMSADTARQLFGHEDPLGQKIQLPVLRDGTTGREEMTVVGITAPVRYSGIDQAADALVYRPFAQQPWRSVFLVARTTGDPEQLVGQLRREIAAVDAAITVSDTATLETVLTDLTAQPRFRAVLLLGFASASVLIAAVGLYGVIAFSASQRRAEIGLRMALGAERRQVRTMILREGLMLVLLGITLGLLGAYALVGLASSLLYGIAPTDAVSFAAAATGVLVFGIAASYLPAVAASRADPMMVLRAE